MLVYILSFHVEEDGVGAGLDRYMEERVNLRVLKDPHHFLYDLIFGKEYSNT